MTFPCFSCPKQVTILMAPERLHFMSKPPLLVSSFPKQVTIRSDMSLWVEFFVRWVKTCEFHDFYDIFRKITVLQILTGERLEWNTEITVSPLWHHWDTLKHGNINICCTFRIRGESWRVIKCFDRFCPLLTTVGTFIDHCWHHYWQNCGLWLKHGNNSFDSLVISA